LHVQRVNILRDIAICNWPVWLEIAYSRPFGEFLRMTGFPLEMDTGARGQKTRCMGLPGGRKVL